MRLSIWVVAVAVAAAGGWRAGAEDVPGAQAVAKLPEMKPMANAGGAERKAKTTVNTYGQKYHKQNQVVIDDFEGSEVENRLGAKVNIFVQNPSRVMISRDRMTRGNGTSHAILLAYDKKKEGGLYNEGGWCGYYTLLKQMRNNEEDCYFDATPFNAITFQVRGEKGDESFIVGLADRHWDKVGDSLKSSNIGQYLPAGRITTDWQQARIPLDTYFLDRGKLSSITIAFESSCFADGSGSGRIWLDDMALEK